MSQFLLCEGQTMLGIALERVLTFDACDFDGALTS